MSFDSFNYIHILLILAVTVTGFYIIGSVVSDLDTSLGGSETGKIAKIPITGTIVSGSGFPRGEVTADGIRSLVQQAKEDNVDAYLFEINSPGGAVVASKDLARVVKSVDKPTVCLMKGVAASGAYWTATECDRIIADSLTITGSIGVNSGYLEFSGLLQRYGVEYVNLTAGRYKDAGVPYKNLTEQEKELFTDQLTAVHQAFIEAVAENRNMSTATVEQYATGETYLGREAADLGLIDATGTQDDAIAYLENRTAMNLTVKQYEGEQGFNLLSMLLTRVGYGIGTALTETGTGKALEVDRSIYQQTYR